MTIPSSISPQEAQRLLAEPDTIILDVRTQAEHRVMHVAGATLKPLQDLTPEKAKSYTGKRVLCLCQKGARGEKAAGILRDAGITTSNIVGGIEAWESAGLPVEKNTQGAHMSLERQVRIAAGLLVVIGVLLGHFVAPAGYLLSLFVGCGLIFAGITDTCGMGMMLAKCPWNN